MLSHIIHKQSMASSLVSPWFPAVHPSNPRLRASSVQIYWSGIAGDVAGTVQLFAANDTNAETAIDTAFIETSDNTDDAELIRLDSAFANYRLKFVPAGITGGTLNAIVYYSF